MGGGSDMEWIIICNPKDYDIKAAFNKLNRINSEV